MKESHWENRLRPMPVSDQAIESINYKIGRTAKTAQQARQAAERTELLMQSRSDSYKRSLLIVQFALATQYVAACVAYFVIHYDRVRTFFFQ